jgi:hypothetical protein
VDKFLKNIYSCHDYLLHRETSFYNTYLVPVCGTDLKAINLEETRSNSINTLGS